MSAGDAFCWVVILTTFYYLRQIWKLTRPRLHKHSVIDEAEFIKDNPALFVHVSDE